MRSPAANRRVLVNSLHHLPPNSVAIRRTNPNKWIELTVGVRRLKQLPDLSALDAKRPGERQYMTRDQLRTDYGSDPAAIAKIEKFAAGHDLVVTRNEPASARLGIAGTVANVSQAFGVKLLNYKHSKLGDFHARTGPVTLPAEVASAITGVFGLNNHRVMHRLPRPRQKVDALASFSRTRPWFIPTELAGIYNFPDADARSQCIGLLEFGGGVEQSDVTAYFQKIGLPAPNVQIVAVDGVNTDPAADPDSTGEVMLDVDIAGALAGGAKVAVYFSTFDEKGLVDILSTVINDQANDPSVVSVSWGWDENQPFNNGILWSAAAIEHVNHSLLAVAHLGITVCVSTGDDGSESQIHDGHAHVNFPATSPYVLAVGGTTLHARKGTNDQMAVAEVVWNDGPGSGGGGGVSDITPIPSWQEGKVPRSINPGSFAGRAIPDVAANADPNTGYLVMSGGQFGIVGGTSASAPLWASLVSRINALNGARAGNFNALLYTAIGPAGALRDITSGNNDTDGLLDGQFRAGPGWDACTGWGAPDGIKLSAALKSRTG
jgi:kumamolisin